MENEPLTSRVRERWSVAHSALITIALFLILVVMIPNYVMVLGLNILVLAVSVAVIVTYAPAWWRILMTQRRLDGPAALSLGIGASWAGELAFRTYSFIWRMLDQPEWLTESPFVPAILTLTFLAGVLDVTAPGAVDGVVPRKNWITLGAVAGVSAFTFCTLIVLARFGLRVI